MKLNVDFKIEFNLIFIYKIFYVSRQMKMKCFQLIQMGSLSSFGSGSYKGSNCSSVTSSMHDGSHFGLLSFVMSKARTPKIIKSNRNQTIAPDLMKM